MRCRRRFRSWLAGLAFVADIQRRAALGASQHPARAMRGRGSILTQLADAAAATVYDPRAGREAASS